MSASWPDSWAVPPIRTSCFANQNKSPDPEGYYYTNESRNKNQLEYKLRRKNIENCRDAFCAFRYAFLICSAFRYPIKRSSGISARNFRSWTLISRTSVEKLQIAVSCFLIIVAVVIQIIYILDNSMQLFSNSRELENALSRTFQYSIECWNVFLR